ncbi:hypothetical protein ACP70R_028341 [Stipagrostis hirtigluma subsp. patula]
MSNHHRFRLSHLIPNSWFYKLRDMKRPRPPSQRNIETARTSNRSSSHYYHGATTPKPLPLISPHRSFPYPNTKRMSMEKLHHSHLHISPKASDIQFPRDHHHHHYPLSTSRTSTIIIEDNCEFQELQLRPIRTRSAPRSANAHSHSPITRGTCPRSPRLRSRGLDVGYSVSNTSIRRRRITARRSFAVVKASTDPSRDFRESMVEMIAENDVRSPEDLQELLECYLSLNSRVYHGLIMEVFREICLEIVED